MGIKSAGEWISSVDLENAITAVDGVPHPKWTERPICILRLKEGVAANPNKEKWLQKVRTHLTANFAKWQLPDDVLFWDKIPETSTRKMDKKTVRKKLKEEGYLHPKVS